MKPILEIRGISKKYQIEGNTKPYLSLRENLFSFLKPSSRKEEFWALRDVSFDVMQGDTIGIVGKNGAGKSTLLKILSKITPPTEGKIISRGRIASLLEVGTGFHPELTGRENIFLNGSILGMKRAEIQKQFDVMVDFSGVEKFINTPLKHYSSGMQLRLAFAVAAFLENEILIIDEVLAVGDAEFQKKCMGKMEDVSRSGRTILFVSHNMSAIQSLCKKSVFLEKGLVRQTGTVDEVIKSYHFEGLDSLSNDLTNLPRAGHHNDQFYFTKIEVLSNTPIYEGDQVRFKLFFTTLTPIHNVGLGFSLTDHLNTNLVECRSYQHGTPCNISKPGNHSAEFQFQMNLKAGIYSMNVGSRSNEGFLDAIQSVLLIEVKSREPEQNKMPLEPTSYGYLLTQSSWKFTDAQ